MKVEFVVDGVVEYSKVGGHHVLTCDGVVVADIKPVVIPPITPKPPAYDYSDPRFDIPVFDFYGSAAKPKEFINGKPVDWDWAAWSLATGRPNPDIKPDTPEGPNRAVFDLKEGDGWVTVNQLNNGQNYVYKYTIRPGTKKAEIYVQGAAGGQVKKVNGMDVIARTVLKANTWAGTHSITIKVEAVGETSVLLRQS